MTNFEPIAIVGMGCRFPGNVGSPAELWGLLRNHADAIGDIPVDRWDPERYFSPEPQTPGRMICRRAGCLQDVAAFDADFFGIVPRVAEQMDPQQRILLEVSWNALEDAGIAPDTLAGEPVGVFIGLCGHDYGDIHSSPSELEGLNAHSATGQFMSIVANRISHALDLRGPSLVIDTACSSSLVALHTAVNALRRDECSLALAGGCNIMLSPYGPISLSQAMMLSPDGHCRAFDASANGYVRGEGAGVVVLKRLADALRDKDRIHAVIRGTAVNQDGRTAGITLPSGEAQERNALAALQEAGVRPSEIGYIEAHGTGTPAGDPIEGNALGRVVATGAESRRDRPVFVGSVKTNIGHLEGGAGIAGLIKAALVVRHRKIPASLNFKNPNPGIDFEKWNMAVPTTTQNWPVADEKAIALVNSFGFGGTNAAAVLEEPPQPEATDASSHNGPATPQLLTLSARSEGALLALVDRWEAHLESSDERTDSLATLARCQAQRRNHNSHRLGVVAKTPREAAALLRQWRIDGSTANVAEGRVPSRERKLAFVFNGQGPQWWGMGRQLFQQEAAFEHAIDECDRIARRFIDWSIRDELSATEQASRVNSAEFLQPTMFAVQIALVALWKSWGVNPQGVMGHSLGDITAACIAGILDLEDALHVVCHRSRIQAKADANGGMLYVALAEGDARRLIQKYPDELWLSAVNAPNATTISGDRRLLTRLQRELDGDGVFARMLRVNCACHSPHMEPLKAELLECVSKLQHRPGDLPFYSTVSGQITSGLTIDQQYWWANFRYPVMFHQAVQSMLADGFDAFVEVGPHPVLLPSLKDIMTAEGSDGIVCHSLRRMEDDLTNLRGTQAQLYVSGVPIDWSAAFAGPSPQLDLPMNPWLGKSYWSETKTGHQARVAPQVHPMIRRTPASLPTWEARWDDHRLRWVKQHQVFGGVVVPAAAYLEMVSGASEALSGKPCVVERVSFERPCVLTPQEPMVSQLVLSPEQLTFEIYSRPVGSDAWVRNCKGRYFTPDDAAHTVRVVDIESVRTRCAITCAHGDLYEVLSKKGYVYGQDFRGIAEFYIGRGEGLARITVPDTEYVAEGYRIPPTLLDACFQSAILHPPASGEYKDLLRYTYLPNSADRMRINADVRFPLWCHTRVRRMDADGFEVDLDLINDHGEVVAEFERLAGAPVKDIRDNDTLQNHSYALTWQSDDSALANGSHAPFSGSLQDVRAEVEPDVVLWSQELRRKEYHGDYVPRMARLCSAYMANLLRDLGIDMTAGSTFRRADLDKVAPSYERFMARSLQFLVANGVLRKRPTKWIVEMGADAFNVEELSAEIARDCGECHPELTLLRRTGPVLARVVTGTHDPLDLLFPQEDPTITEPLFSTSPSSRIYARMVRRVAEALVSRSDPRQLLRVLEVGAGSGGLTSHLLPVLPYSRTQYHFTDISAAFLKPLQNREEEVSRPRFAEYPNVTVRQFDVEQSPESQGLLPGYYDLIVASDVIHATRELMPPLRHLQRLLAPGGILAMIEACPDNPWLHLTFGLTDGWWHFTDIDRRVDGPLLSPERWLDLLRQIGFADAFALHDTPRGPASGQCVLIAQKGPGPVIGTALESGTQGGRWLILADRSGLGQRLEEHIRRRGGDAKCVGRLQDDSGAATVETPRIAPNDELALKALVQSEDWDGVIHLWNLDHATDEPDADSLQRSVVTGTVSISHVMSGLVAKRQETPDIETKLFVVTRGAHPILNSQVAVTQTPAWGIALASSLEFPEILFRMIDLSYQSTTDEAALLWDEMCRDDPEREVAFLGTQRFVRRLQRVPADAPDGLVSSRDLLEQGKGFALESTSGARQLDSVHWIEASRRQPRDGEIEVEVRAADLNFLDVLTALGQVPRVHDNQRGFGGECAGIVSSIGGNVDTFRQGDEVIVTGAALGCLASHVTVSALNVFRKPKHLSFEEACELPIAFLTAWHVLKVLARVEASERVLIHSATGGTGLACVQVARALGAQVFATAGNDDKRAYLRALGAKFVASSRSLRFADDVMHATGGAGVDVIVNSLAGEVGSRNMACLAPYGRLIDIGKRDFIEDKGMGLRPFLQNRSYFGFDLRQMMLDHPQLVKNELDEVLRHFEDGTLRPLPRRLYHSADAGRAFRQMSRASHIGKLTVALQESPVMVARRRPGASPLRGAWLLAGGLGGFGLRVAEELALRGVRSLTLLGRTIGAAQLDRVEQIKRETGADVRAVALDVTDRDGLQRLLADKRLADLKGVIHCAMTLEDAQVTSFTEESILRVVRPKMIGAWNLHELTADRELDAFVLFSSIASMLGNHGQGNYAAANAFLDGLAHYRQARHLPVTCVNWGVISDVGYVAERPDLKDRLERSGSYGLSSKEAVDLLIETLAGRRAQLGVFRMDWQQFGKALPGGADRYPRYRGLLRDQAALHDAGSIRSETADDALADITERLLSRVAAVSGAGREQMDAERPLIEYLDSLLIMEIIEWIRKEFDLSYTVMDIMKGSTGSQLAARIHHDCHQIADVEQPHVETLEVAV